MTHGAMLDPLWFVGSLTQLPSFGRLPCPGFEKRVELVIGAPKISVKHHRWNVRTTVNDSQVVICGVFEYRGGIFTEEFKAKFGQIPRV